MNGNLRGLLTFAMPKDTTPPNFAEKTYANSHKTAKFKKKFLPRKFPAIQYSHICFLVQLHDMINTHAYTMCSGDEKEFWSPLKTKLCLSLDSQGCFGD